MISQITGKPDENLPGNAKDNIVTSYSAENAEHPDWFIYQYSSGRRVLVEVDAKSGKVHFIKEL